MNKRRGSLGVAVMKNYLYAVGGQDTPSQSSVKVILFFKKYFLINKFKKPIGEAERYDINTDQWTILTAKLNQPREGVSCGVLGDTIYAIGGVDGKGLFLIN